MISGLKQLAQKEDLEFLNQILERVNNFIVITNPEHKIIWINKAFENHTGFTLEEVYLKKPGEFLHGPETNQAMVKQMNDAILAEQYFQIEIINYTKGGDPYWVQIDCSPIFIKNKLAAYIAIESDISVRKNEELKTNNYNKFLIDLLEDISHELRSPLTSILGLHEVLQYSQTFEEKVEIFDLLNISIKELDEMIKQLNIKIFNELNIGN